MLRSILATLMIVTALGLGVVVAGLASSNRAQGADLDRRQRESQILRRQNEQQRARNIQAEFELIQSTKVEHTTH